MNSPVLFVVSEQEFISINDGILQSTIDKGPYDSDYAIAIDTLESTLLALHSVGVELTSTEVHQAIVGEVELLADKFSN
jgi:hypothetical protein